MLRDNPRTREQSPPGQTKHEKNSENSYLSPRTMTTHHLRRHKSRASAQIHSPFQVEGTICGGWNRDPLEYTDLKGAEQTRLHRATELLSGRRANQLGLVGLLNPSSHPEIVFTRPRSSTRNQSGSRATERSRHPS